MDPSLFKLPWEALLTLASGYAAYFVANVGVREHHKSIDIALSTLVFGFFGAFSYEVLRRFIVSDILASSILSFLLASLLGGLWNRYGRGLLTLVLRSSNVSHSDDLPSAWLALFTRTETFAKQISVKLKDGTWLKCDDAARFGKKPNGPFVLGGSGDLLMFVTHQQDPGGEFYECPDVESGEWGPEITYIPKEQIARIDIRRT
ncbi:DUF6338 family protein [Mesorhizobium sp. WSM3626]|uniref:DUF6338 family protein n=1 Tax=Mesorhizobium sp. WSM3626 TaxID=1040987 RepID=UPI00048232F5|nr:DUF6338 family protein [Mesorhizobium sp. WSM3626]